MAGNKKQANTMRETFGPEVFESIGQEGGVAAALTGRTYYFSDPQNAEKARLKGLQTRRKRKGK